MAPLPCHRLTPFKPAFLYTGIDYFGPVTVKMLGRGSRLEKRWICLFTFFWPQELSTSKWPSKRRRLSCLFLEIYESTPASASNIQRQQYQLTSWRTREAVDGWIKKQEDIQINAAHYDMEWQFSPRHRPHFCGVWERLVQASKWAMRVLGNGKTTSDRQDSVSNRSRSFNATQH